MTAGTSTAMYGSAEAEVQAVVPLCTYLMRTEGKVSKNAVYPGKEVRQTFYYHVQSWQSKVTNNLMTGIAGCSGDYA